LGRARGSGRAQGKYVSLAGLHQFEASGSRVASNRSMQWGEQIVKPIFESKNDLEIIYLLAAKLGIADKMFKNIKVENNNPLPEDILREMKSRQLVDRLLRTVAERIQAAHGQPERLRPGHDARDERSGQRRLLRPTWRAGQSGGQASGHAASLQYESQCHGWRWHLPRPLRRRAQWGEPAGRRVLLAGSEIKDGYPEFTMGC